MRRRPSFAAMRRPAIFIGMLLMLALLGACNKRADEDEEVRQAQANNSPASISVENGQTVLTLDSPTQNRLGLEIATLTPSVTRQQVTVPATVLSTEDLAAARNGYLAAQAQLQKSRIEARVASQEYARSKALFEENQNISQKSLQAAQGTAQVNEADVTAVEQQVNLQASMVRQAWGGVIAMWVAKGSPELQSIFDQREMLVQVTMPSTSTLAPPKSLWLEISGSERTGASFVSPYPRVDPRIQGKSFLYLVPARSGLAPGANVLADFSAGKEMRGVIVPASGVVWSEGRAWAYQETAPGRFTRRAVATDTPVEKGFFVATGLSPNDKIVTHGAQTLLSEELLVHAQGSEESDDD
jgi:hypothetical protein